MGTPLGGVLLPRHWRSSLTPIACPLIPKQVASGAHLKFYNHKDSTLILYLFYHFLRHVLNTRSLDTPHIFCFVSQQALDEVPHMKTESQSHKKELSKKRHFRCHWRRKSKKGQRIWVHDGNNNNKEEEGSDISEEEEFDLNKLSSDSKYSIQTRPSPRDFCYYILFLAYLTYIQSYYCIDSSPLLPPICMLYVLFLGPYLIAYSRSASIWGKLRVECDRVVRGVRVVEK